MAGVEKPAEGSWTAHYPELGTGPISYEDSISPEFYDLEREAIFKRAWLNVGRVEQLPRNGSYFTKELAVASTSLIIVRGTDGVIRAFHNMCRHRGNKLVWTDDPAAENFLLPPALSDLEPFAEAWCLATEGERYAKRLNSTMEEMQAFYDAVLPRVEEAIAYCDKFPLDDMPDDARWLLLLLYSFVTVSFPIEVWRQPHVLDCRSCSLDLEIEPVP